MRSAWLVLILLLLVKPRGVCGMCLEGWFEVDSTCYNVIATSLSRELAYTSCKGRGGELASFSSLAHLDSVAARICAANVGKVWIGYNVTGGKWSWADGKSTWSPLSSSTVECAVATLGNKANSVDPNNCTNSAPSLCAAPALPGPEGWVAIGGTAVFISHGTSGWTWSRGADACGSGSWPVSIGNAVVMQQVYDHFESTECITDFWTGGYCHDQNSPRKCLTTADAKWQDMSPFDTSLLDLSAGAGGCITMEGTRLTESLCSDLLPFLCEAPLPTPSPTPTPTPAPTPNPTPPSTPSPTPAPTPAPTPPLPTTLTTTPIPSSAPNSTTAQSEDPPPPSEPLLLATPVPTLRSELGRIAEELHPKAVGGLAGASSLVGAVQGSPLLGAQVMVMGIGCNVVTDLPVVLHPTRMTVGRGELQEYLGCAMGNTALGIVILAVQWAGSRAYRRVNEMEPRAAEGAVHYPGAGLTICLLLFQGATFSAFRLAVWGYGTERLAGTLVAFISTLFVCWVVGALQMVSRKADYLPRGPTPDVPRSVAWLLPRGQWVSQEKLVVERFGLLFAKYNTKAAAFVGAQLLITGLMGAMAGAEVTTYTACGVLSAAKCALGVLQVMAIFVMSPYSSAWEKRLDVTVSLVAAMGCLMTAVGYSSLSPSFWTFPVAGALFITGAALAVVRSLIAAASFFVRRRYPHVDSEPFPQHLPPPSSPTLTGTSSALATPFIGSGRGSLSVNPSLSLHQYLGTERGAPSLL